MGPAATSVPRAKPRIGSTTGASAVCGDDTVVADRRCAHAHDRGWVDRRPSRGTLGVRARTHRPPSGAAARGRARGANAGSGRHPPVDFARVAERSRAARRESSSPTCVWLGGGAQSRLERAYVGTAVETELLRRAALHLRRWLRQPRAGEHGCVSLLEVGRRLKPRPLARGAHFAGSMRHTTPVSPVGPLRSEVST